MPDENTSSQPVDTSPSLVSVVGDMFGDYTTEPESDAGAPPATTLETTAASSEGDTPSAPAADPAAPADATVDPDPSAPAPTDDDPFEGSKPLAYTVDGQERTFDGITVLKHGGAIIDPEALEKVQRVVGERDHLYERSQQDHQKYSDLERLTTWTFKDDKGAEHTLTGTRGVEALRLEAASDKAALHTLVAAMANPDKFAELADLIKVDANGNQVPWDAEGRLMIVRNDQAWKELTRESSLNVRDKRYSVRDELSKLSAPPPPAEPDVATFAMPTIDQLSSQHGLTALTAADKQFLATQFAQYTRPATPAERQQYGVPRLVLPSFIELAKNQNALRADAAKVAATATTAATNNAGRLAAASIGKKGGTLAPKIAPKKDVAPSREESFDDMWERQERAAAGALRGTRAS